LFSHFWQSALPVDAVVGHDGPEKGPASAWLPESKVGKPVSNRGTPLSVSGKLPSNPGVVASKHRRAGDAVAFACDGGARGLLGGREREAAQVE
jgi:hypothetical protein